MDYASIIADGIAAPGTMDLKSALHSAESDMDEDAKQTQRKAIEAYGLREPFASAVLWAMRTAGDSPSEP